MATFQELAKSLYPNMPIDILDLFADEWAKTGDPNVAIANVRRTTAYDIAFLVTKDLMALLNLMKLLTQD